MDDDAEFVPFKVYPVITEAKPVQNLSVPLEFSETLQIRLHHLLG